METRILKKEFMRYVPRSIFSMLALSCYIMADTYFVANGVSADGLAALNIALPLFSFTGGIGALLGVGGATLFNIYSSSGRNDGAHSVYTTTLCAAAAIGAAFSVTGILFAPKLAALLGAGSDIIGYSSSYLRTIMIFAPAFILNKVMSCFVRNDGEPGLTMLAMVTGSLSNVVMDYIFIFPLGMGMFGAALATCVAPLIGIAILSTHWLRKKNSMRFLPREIKIKRLPRICSVGFSAFVTEFMAGIVTLIFNKVFLAEAGNTGVAAYGIITNVSFVAISIFTGIAEGVQPLISRSYAKGGLKDVKRLYIWAAGLGTAIGAVITLLLNAFNPAIVSLFNKDAMPHLAALGREGIRLYFWALPVAAVNVITASLFASMSKAANAFTISILRSIVFIAALVLPLSKAFSTAGTWLTTPLAETMTLAVCVIFLIGFKRKHRKTAV